MNDIDINVNEDNYIEFVNYLYSINYITKNDNERLVNWYTDVNDYFQKEYNSYEYRLFFDRKEWDIIACCCGGSEFFKKVTFINNLKELEVYMNCLKMGLL